MIYDKRNRENLNKLADHTRVAAYKWYQYCIDKKYQVLIYETLRDKATQQKYVQEGKSQTMRSYHLVGQALDFVFVDNNGKALWSINAYVTKMDVINYAKKCGFTWGGDWDNDGDWRDETFLDSPHLQYEYTGYGKDTFGKIKGNGDVLTVDQFNILMSKINAQNEELAKLKKQVATKADVESDAEVHESHKVAWDWAIDEGIIKGNGTTLNPNGALTRQQMATMLKRYHDKHVANK
ncbi:M15 family metallopeptidase [Lysinibacillus sp. KU-BSD001]